MRRWGTRFPALRLLAIVLCCLIGIAPGPGLRGASPGLAPLPPEIVAALGTICSHDGPVTLADGSGDPDQDRSPCGHPCCLTSVPRQDVEQPALATAFPAPSTPVSIAAIDHIVAGDCLLPDEPPSGRPRARAPPASV